MRNDGRNCSRSLGQKKENNNIYREREREKGFLLDIYVLLYLRNHGKSSI